MSSQLFFVEMCKHFFAGDRRIKKEDGYIMQIIANTGLS